MRITIVAIGRMKQGAEASLLASYKKRLPWQLDVLEVELKKNLKNSEERKALEAEKLVSLIPDGAFTILLDEHGKNMSSRAFAELIGRELDGGTRDIALLIGGADGHGPAARTRANAVLALGSLTWPHMMVRIMLAEQVYRAWSILSGHPYHRD